MSEINAFAGPNPYRASMPDPLSEQDVSETIGLDSPAGRRRRALRWLVLSVILLVAAGGAWWGLSVWRAGERVQYVTVPVERGRLDVTVTATGTLEATNEVEISSELSGTVRKVHVDHNDPVEAGQTLAELDTDKLEAQVVRARAAVDMARARVKEAEAVLAEARRKFERYSGLASRKVVSEQELDVARAAYEQAAAALESADADVKVAEADLQLQETELDKACICSPIDGVVLRRSVDPGQTVAASLQAPVLFLLAEDLRAMELQVDVDEADISLVQEGQAASFTVDAYPDRIFPATVTKVRFAPDSTEGVVTYKTHLTVDNADLLLRPGMTATAQIMVRSVEDAVLVRNEALRFEPPQADAADGDGGGLLQSILPRRPRSRSPANRLEGNALRVWVLENGALEAIPVRTGSSDGQMTEILAGEIEPGMQVVTDMREAG